MAYLTTDEITGATAGRLLQGGRDAVFAGISIDSRTIREGELFVAIKGQRYDGHDFLNAALRQGGGAVVSILPPGPVEDKAIVYVNDTLKALQDLARSMRKKRDVTVVAVTGTNGKTTTKEMIAAILSIRHKVLKNYGNLNNHIGLPLSLMKIEEGDEFAVLEMGASSRGDIKQLCEIALPDYGVITNIGLAHLEGFGSLEIVRRTKLELFEAAGNISLNADDRFLAEGVSCCPEYSEKNITTFGIDNSADIFARDINLGDGYSVFSLCLGKDECLKVRLEVPGRFNIYNALAAASVCRALGIAPADIKQGIESFKGVPMRLEFTSLRGAAVISDVYNANPTSMEEAVKELVRMRKSRAIAVLGDMLELGAYAEDAHRKLGKWMAALPVDVFIAVGPLMSRAAEEFSDDNRCAVVAHDSSEAGKILLDICREGDTILVKGSRGMKMELVAEDPARNSIRFGESVHAL